MKRVLCVFLTTIMVAACFTFFGTAASAETETYDLGELTVVKLNGLWDPNGENALAVFTPGTSMNGKYWTKLYARYDSQLEAYVVEEKVGCHRDYPKVVETGCIGIMFNYAPLSTSGSALAIKNWLVFDRIKVGDRLTLSGIDVAKKTIDVTGTYGQSGFASNAKIKVTAVRDKDARKTPYTDKTIVAMGDSITVGGGWTYDLGDAIGADIINSGFGGDTATASLAARYDTYVAAYKPDIVIVSFGINDACSSYNYSNLAGAMDKYEEALRSIQKKNAELGAKTVFQTPNNVNVSYFEDRAPAGTYAAYGGLQGYIDQFIDRMRTVAEDTGCPVIDIYAKWKELGWGADKTNLLDNTHPTEVGYDMNLEVMIPFWKENYKTLCDYNEDFDFDPPVVQTLLGDVNGDEVVDNADAALILKADSGVSTLTEEQQAAADVNGDGVADNSDAALILRLEAKLITEFPINGDGSASQG